ncbi:hypothetical protein TRIP_B330591 [uncultured Desulfatiglans sp.]|nr:hypothetical protein TRIP_B330591 [uncultured Desulfatiglans sp.]
MGRFDGIVFIRYMVVIRKIVEMARLMFGSVNLYAHAGGDGWTTTSGGRGWMQDKKRSWVFWQWSRIRFPSMH